MNSLHSFLSPLLEPQHKKHSFCDVLLIKSKLHTIILPQVECIPEIFPQKYLPTLPPVTKDQETAL